MNPMQQTKIPIQDTTYVSINSLADGGYGRIRIADGEVHIHTSHYYIAFSVADWKRLSKEAEKLIKTHEKENYNG